MLTDEQKAQLQRLLDNALLGGQEESPHNLFNGIHRQAAANGIPFDATVLLEYFWQLARLGFVAVPGSDIGMLPFKMPHMLLTARGRKFLETGDASPHETNRYIAALKRRVSHPDDIVLSYLTEAAEAWQCGLNRSSAVMLGCACERMVLMLAEAIAAANCPPWSTQLGKKLKNRVFISEVFDDVRDALLNLRSQKKLPKGAADALDRKLSPIFDHARGLRNHSGHPTGEEVTTQDAEAGLLLFPGFCELIENLITVVKTI